MISPDEDLSLIAISLPRPLAGAVARGLVPTVSLEGVGFDLPRGGVLVVIHAGPTWVPEDVSALHAPVKGWLVEDPDRPARWPDCPQSPAAHPEGLVGVGLLHALLWAPANDALLDVLDPMGPIGPWVLGLRDVVTFKSPAPYLGYDRPFDLPPQLTERIVRAWVERPVEAPAPPPDWDPAADPDPTP